MIYLNAECINSLGEDTYWTWLKRELGDISTFSVATAVTSKDVILRYATLGSSGFPRNTIALLWELYPQMKEIGIFCDGRIGAMAHCAANAARRTVATPLMAPYFEKFGKVDVLPLAVDTDLFCPYGPLAAASGGSLSFIAWRIFPRRRCPGSGL